MFGSGRKAAVKQRAGLFARMIGLIMHGLKTKPYDQFVASFSNPGKEPDAFDRSNRELHFQMRISKICWCDATASYPLRAVAHQRNRRKRRTFGLSFYLEF